MSVHSLLTSTSFFQVFISSWELYMEYVRKKNMGSAVISAFSTLVRAANKLNRIPKLNLFKSNITRHIPYFRETAVMQSWMFKADSRAEPTKDLRSQDWPRECTCPFSHMSWLYKATPDRAVVTMLQKRGMGPRQWLMCTQNVWPARLSSFHVYSSLHLLFLL